VGLPSADLVAICRAIEELRDRLRLEQPRDERRLADLQDLWGRVNDRLPKKPPHL
jgi:hypothetical protein